MLLHELQCRTVRGLPGLDTQQDFVEMLDTLKGMIETFKVRTPCSAFVPGLHSYCVRH
jgi:hypothetical protein